MNEKADHVSQMENVNRVAVIIPVFNRRETTLGCLNALADMSWTDVDLRIVVVDDGSTDGTGDAIRQSFPGVIVLPGNGDLWWTGAINLGLKYAVENGFDYVLLLNDDVELAPDFFEHLLACARENQNSLISSIKLVRRGGYDSVAIAGLRIAGFLQQVVDPLIGTKYLSLSDRKEVECDLLTGASLLIPVAVIRDIGYMDWHNFPHNWGDFEYTLRARKRGYRCLVATRSRIYADGDNPNYHERYFVESTRADYLKNLFDNHRYNYGFKRIYAISFMHRPWYLAILLYLRRLGGLIKSILMKLFISRNKLSERYRG